MLSTAPSSKHGFWNGCVTTAERIEGYSSASRVVHILQSTDQLVVVHNFVYCQEVNIGRNIRVRDTVTIMRPSDTHGYIWPRWAPKTSLDDYLGKAVNLSRVSDAVLDFPQWERFRLPHSFSVSIGPLSRSTIFESWLGRKAWSKTRKEKGENFVRCTKRCKKGGNKRVRTKGFTLLFKKFFFLHLLFFFKKKKFFVYSK